MLTKSLSSKKLIVDPDPLMEETAPANREPYLLEQLGGMMVLKSIIHEFGRRMSRDVTLQKYFGELNPQLLTAHQERFFAMALTEVNVPDATLMIRQTHHYLFARGLNEEHFDILTMHFEDTLIDRGFTVAIVGKALSNLAPLRDIFQDAAEEWQDNTEASTQCSSPQTTKSLVNPL
jgi:truncated hemoglobin YjbI